VKRLWFVLLLFLAAPVQALELKGELVQGGFVAGKVAPGSAVTLNGRAVSVGPDGSFALGFPYDAPATAELSVRDKQGKSEQRTLSIASRQFQVQRIDGLPEAMVTPPPEVLERIRQENERINAARKIVSLVAHFAQGFRWPATGPISGVFGSQRILNGKPRNVHYGVDVAAPKGTPIVAAAAGTVTLAGDLYFSGNTVFVDHGLGVNTSYLHMDSISVKEGQAVKAGEALGTLGATGRATGPHLHWGLNWFEVRLDPALIVPPMPADKR
jgi:murein DD-endopeptidase MepM/ murein hydrolase activator NlpD